jgi:hypothetical protein
MIKTRFKLEISTLKIDIETCEKITISTLRLDTPNFISSNMVTKSELLELSELFKLAAENTGEIKKENTEI